MGKRLVDLVDSSHTVAMRFSTRIPNVESLFEDPEEASIARSAEQKKEVASDDINYDDLEIEDEVLGVGAFGNVFKGKYKGEEVAVKEILNSDVDVIQKLIVREVKALKAVDHPNIIHYIGICDHISGLYIVTEFVDGGDLRKLLKDSSKDISWQTRVSISTGICNAMIYLHNKGLLHRDLKSKNVLLEEGTQNAKLCDFGFAREQDDDENKMTLKVGTDKWMAPEVCSGAPYDFKADVFSYGMMLFEIITRQKPLERSLKNKFEFQNNEFLETMTSCTQKDPPPPEYPQLALECTEYDFNKRPTFPQIKPKLQAILAKL